MANKAEREIDVRSTALRCIHEAGTTRNGNNKSNVVLIFRFKKEKWYFVLRLGLSVENCICSVRSQTL